MIDLVGVGAQLEKSGIPQAEKAEVEIVERSLLRYQLNC
jgi:hypothetical protein